MAERRDGVVQGCLMVVLFHGLEAVPYGNAHASERQRRHGRCRQYQADQVEYEA